MPEHIRKSDITDAVMGHGPSFCPRRNAGAARVIFFFSVLVTGFFFSACSSSSMNADQNPIVLEFVQNPRAQSISLRYVIVEDQSAALQLGETRAVHYNVSKPGQLLVIDHSSRTYTIYDEQGIDALAQGLNRRMQEMEAQARELDGAEQERALERLNELFGGKGVDLPEPILTQLERFGHYSDIPCRWFEISRAGELTGEGCFVSPEDLSGGEVLQAMLYQMNRFHRRLRDAQTHEIAMGLNLMPMTEFVGSGMIPIALAEQAAGRQALNRTELVNVRQSEMAKDSIGVPDGYTRTSLIP